MSDFMHIKIIEIFKKLASLHYDNNIIKMLKNFRRRNNVGIHHKIVKTLHRSNDK